MQRAKRKTDFLMIGLLFLAALYCFGDWFFKQEIVLFRDLHHYFYPLRQYTIQCFKQGIFPWWNPYILLGTPHFASMQFGVLYPLSLIYVIGNFPFAFNLFIFTHLFLTALFSFLFFKELKFSPLASAWSAFSWMMSGYLVSAINLLNILGSITWFPLVLLFFRRALVLQDRRYCFWSSVALLMMFLGSEAGITLLTVWILLGYTLIRGWKSPRKAMCFYLATWGFTVVVFIGLSAFQWIPSLEYLLQTERTQMDFKQATVWSVPVRDLLNLLFPFVTDPWIPKQDYWVRQSLLASYYVGSLPWIFLLCLLGLRRIVQLKWFLIGLISSLILALGRFSPLYEILYRYIPGLSWVRYPARLFFLPTFLLCWFLGYALDYLIKASRGKSLSRRFSFAFLKVSFLIAVVMLVMNQKEVLDQIQDLFPSNEGNAIFFAQIAFLNIWRNFGIWIVSWLLLWQIFRFPSYRSLGLTGLSFLLVWDLAGVHKGLNNTVSISEFLKSTPSVEFLKKQKGYFRICPSPKHYSRYQYLPTQDFPSAIASSFESCVPDRLVPMGIFDVSGYDSLYLERYGKLWGTLLRSKSPIEHNLYHLLNVRYLMTPEPLPIKSKGLEPVYQSEQFYLYENQFFLQRAFLVPQAVFMTDPEKILERIRDPEFRPKEEVILEKESDSFLTLIGSSKKEPGSFSEDTVEIQSYTPNRVKIHAETTIPKILVLSDAYYPGWKATLDGRRIPLFRADYYLRAIEVPEGSHQVEFFYKPWWLFVAPMISLIMLIGSVSYVRPFL